MKLAVLSDIHGNYIALRKCLDYAKQENVDGFLFLGDYTGELPQPREVLECLYQLQQTYPCYIIRGNREGYLLEYRKNGETGWHKGNSSSGSLLYTYERMRPEDLDFLASLPEAQRIEFSGYPPITICHGSPERINEQLLVGSERTKEILKKEPNTYLICGHTHFQGEFRYEGKVLLNPGSAGLSQEAYGKAQFMILHGSECAWQWEFVCLEYDVEQLIAQLHEKELHLYAPHWCTVTRHLLRGGLVDHGMVLVRAQEINAKKYGPGRMLSEESWAQAVQEML